MTSVRPSTPGGSASGSEVGADGAYRPDRFLTERSLADPPKTVDRLARELLNGLDPDGQDRFDPLAYTRRELTLKKTSDGMLVGTLQAAGVDAAVIWAAVEHASAPDPAQRDEDGVLIPDLRTAAQRRVDGLAGIARVYLANCGSTARMEPPHVLVVATPEQVRDELGAGLADDPTSGTAVPRATLRQLLCDAMVQPVVLDGNGAVLALGRAQRTATREQRRALTGRDRGCVIPGCGAPPSWCDAHHVTPWNDNGATDLENMVLLCGRHHRLVHQGVWELEMIDGVPWATPPPGIDPQRRPRRNTRHHDLDHARRLGHQLRLDLTA